MLKKLIIFVFVVVSYTYQENPSFFGFPPEIPAGSLLPTQKILKSTVDVSTLQVVVFGQPGTVKRLDHKRPPGRCVQHPYPTHCWIWSWPLGAEKELGIMGSKQKTPPNAMVSS